VNRICLLVLALLLTVGCSVASAQPDSVPVIDTGIDSATWAVIPAGEFLMGQHNRAVLLDHDYEIMVTSVTNAQYAGYLNKALAAGTIKIVDNQVAGYYPGDVYHGYKHEEEIGPGDRLHVPLTDPGLRLDFDRQLFATKRGYENHPMVMVTWFGAKAYCEFFGWRLPGETEWEKAARGNDARPFPWGDEIERNRANFYSSFDLFEKI